MTIATASVFASGTAVADPVIHDDGFFNSLLSYKEGEHIFTGKNIEFTPPHAQSKDLITVEGQTKISIGTNETANITFTSDAPDGNAVLFAKPNNTDSPVINIEAIDTIRLQSNNGCGIWLQNNTQHEDRPQQHTTANLTAKNILIDTAGSALLAFSNSEINIESTGGIISINSDTNAIDVRGNSLVNINAKDEAESVVIHGDLAFETAPTGSGNLIDADVNVVFSGHASSWTGDVYKFYPEGFDVGSVDGMNITLKNGATWNVKLISDPTPPEEDGIFEFGTVNHLTLTEGVVNIVDTDRQLVVENFSGTGGSVILAAKVAEKSDTFETASLAIQAVDHNSAPVLNVVFDGISADDITDVDTAMGSLNNAVSGNLERTLTVNEGDIMGAIVATVDEEGLISKTTQTSNEKLELLTSLTSLGTLQWRHEMNDLMKRMGELRDSPAGVGAWVRLTGAEQEYGKQDLVLKGTTVQVGSDYRLGDWTVGGAFSYTNGTADVHLGDADTNAYSAAVYGTWLGNNGLFIDLIGKYSRLENDFLIRTMEGSVANNAYSMSAELGWRLAVTNLAYIEPQLEATYGRIVGDDFTTGNGVHVEQDDTDALLGRIGLRVGLQYPENRGSIYARLSGVYDFKGESQATFTKNNQTVTYNDDIGGGWIEYAIGANLNLTDLTYAYVDLERTSGGDVTENWRWNLGLRTVF